MKLTKQSSFGNTALVGNITYRLVGVYGLTIGFGAFLFMSPLFKWNWLAMAAYVALVSIVVGQTPTFRSVFMNIYGIVFKKPIRMVVSEKATTNTLGHGTRDVILEDDYTAPAFKLMNGNYAMVYHVTSNLNMWSTPEDFERQAALMKSLYNVLEGGEGLMIVTKPDSDTGMLQLREVLRSRENFEGDDMAKMSAKRQQLLTNVATSDVGRSVQQYVIIMMKPRNYKRVYNALQKSSRLMRPASNPADILLSAMGLEGGTLLKGGSDGNV